MTPAVKNSIALTMLILGLICIARGVLGAEQMRPFQWALVMALPHKPQEVLWLHDSDTACNLDLASAANVAPRGTRFKCERRKF